VNGYASNIKKEDILNIINRFSKTGVEERGIKIYIIYGIEYATSQAVNSLLKFLEEPPKNTYAILTTRSINLVLPTIKSRCQTYILKSNIKSTNEKLNQFKLTIEQKQIISRVYHSYDDINTDLRDNTFNNAYNLAKIFIDKKNDLISIKQLQEQFAKFNYKQIELVLKILIAILPNNEKLFELLTNINVNPIKILLFDNI
jgi:DNA polymerase-3 subunit delta'